LKWATHLAEQLDRGVTLEAAVIYTREADQMRMAIAGLARIKA